MKMDVSRRRDQRISVLLVDDHALVRRGVRGFLETQSDIEVAGEAESGEAAVAAAGRLSPDVALVDLLLPQMDGIETTKGILEASPGTRVIILTSYHRDEHIFPAIRSGALSYLLKDVAPEELAAALRKAAVGETVLDSRIAARLVGRIRGEGEDPGALSDLTERELEVLRLIANGSNNRQIAGSLFISEKTVKSHVSSILLKLDLNDRTQAAVFAWRMGIVRRGQG